VGRADPAACLAVGRVGGAGVAGLADFPLVGPRYSVVRADVSRDWEALRRSVFFKIPRVCA
jgi:hypothetical protein